MALSSCEAKYITGSSASTQALWLAWLLCDLLGKEAAAVELRVDVKSALALAKNSVFHDYSKHIQVKFQFIHGFLEEGSIKADYIAMQDQLTDILTMSLGQIKFHELLDRIGMTRTTV